MIALSGNANGILVFAIGAALWLGGHRLHALRHGQYKSPLAELLAIGIVDRSDLPLTSTGAVRAKEVHR